jgi:hypothetical protein
MHNFHRLKQQPKIWKTFAIFKVTARSKQLPNGQKFAQSGHPDSAENNFLLQFFPKARSNQWFGAILDLVSGTRPS